MLWTQKIRNVVGDQKYDLGLSRTKTTYLSHIHARLQVMVAPNNARFTSFITLYFFSRRHAKVVTSEKIVFPLSTYFKEPSYLIRPTDRARETQYSHPPSSCQSSIFQCPARNWQVAFQPHHSQIRRSAANPTTPERFLS